MSDRAEQFFGEIGQHGCERLLEEATGTMRFELEHENGIEYWFLSISNANVEVSRDKRDADTVLHLNRTLFDRMTVGEANLYTAWVRNELRIQGDVRLARLFQRVLPGPRGSRHPRTLAPARRRQA